MLAQKVITSGATRGQRTRDYKANVVRAGLPLLVPQSVVHRSTAAALPRSMLESSVSGPIPDRWIRIYSLTRFPKELCTLKFEKHWLRLRALGFFLATIEVLIVNWDDSFEKVYLLIGYTVTLVSFQSHFFPQQYDLGKKLHFQPLEHCFDKQVLHKGRDGWMNHPDTEKSHFLTTFYVPAILYFGDLMEDECLFVPLSINCFKYFCNKTKKKFSYIYTYMFKYSCHIQVSFLRASPIFWCLFLPI